MRRETPSPVCYKRVHVDSKIKYTEFYNTCVLIFMHYTVCYFTGIFYAVVKQISMLFIDNKDSVSSRKDGSAEENNKQTNK